MTNHDPGRRPGADALLRPRFIMRYPATVTQPAPLIEDDEAEAKARALAAAIAESDPTPAPCRIRRSASGCCASPRATSMLRRRRYASKSIFS
jgi:hypothetical protein